MPGDFERTMLPDTAVRDPVDPRADSHATPGMSDGLWPLMWIWVRPRVTMRHILDTNPEFLVLLLAAIGGMWQSLNRASLKNLGDDVGLPIILSMAIAMGPIGGIIGLYIGGWLISWTGRWLGGVGSARQLRAALAWGSVPAVFAGLLWGPELLLVGAEMFTEATPRLDAAPVSIALLLVGLGVLEITAGVWSIVATFKCTAEAHGFGAWMAVLNFIVAGVIILIPLVVIATLIVASQSV